MRTRWLKWLEVLMPPPDDWRQELRERLADALAISAPDGPHIHHVLDPSLNEVVINPDAAKYSDLLTEAQKQSLELKEEAVVNRCDGTYVNGAGDQRRCGSFEGCGLVGCPAKGCTCGKEPHEWDCPKSRRVPRFG